MNREIDDTMDIRAIYKSKFLVGEDLDGKEHVCTIERVALQQMPGDDGEMETKLKLRLSGFPRPLVLGKKEAGKLGRLMGTACARDWVGGVITLYPFRGKFFGVTQVVPRLRNEATKPPATKPPAPTVG